VESSTRRAYYWADCAPPNERVDDFHTKLSDFLDARFAEQEIYPKPSRHRPKGDFCRWNAANRLEDIESIASVAPCTTALGTKRHD
jgi:hypothetical protein